jgi:preprotein translocase subunit SecG
MKNSIAMTVVTAPLLATGAVLAQNGNMMNGGMMSGSGWMGGYGGYWVPILLVVVVGLVAWIVMQKRK